VLKEILKFPNVKNYDGSWIEWSYLAQQGEKPIKKNTSLEVFEKEKEKLMATLAKK
jgi:thiosulfate/3-mercaptopyruvate sulfurtransferase